MELVFVGETSMLDSLSSIHQRSPEDFLIYLEDALENGELSLSEVYQLIDLNLTRKAL